MQYILFFLRNFSHLHALLESPRVLISEEPATYTDFYVLNINNSPPKSPYLNLHVYFILDVFATHTVFLQEWTIKE